uniref:Uncharacterized protein n=1 Tax=Myotis myotis TaxID=51298 RepID=A0A7J7XZV0_MYOMY|nr:hypothetical protein mMyoMyo1_011358 [Myotis myotis]
MPPWPGSCLCRRVPDCLPLAHKAITVTQGPRADTEVDTEVCAFSSESLDQFDHISSGEQDSPAGRPCGRGPWKLLTPPCSAKTNTLCLLFPGLGLDRRKHTFWALLSLVIVNISVIITKK